ANMRICPHNLIVVVVDAEDRGAGKSGYRPHRTTDTAAHVENVKSWPEPKPQGDDMLEAGRRLTHRLAFEPGGKMERVSPAIFVEIRHQIVEMVDDGRVLSLFCSRTGRPLGHQMAIFLQRSPYSVLRWRASKHIAQTSR